MDEELHKKRQAQAAEHLFNILNSESDEWDSRDDDEVVAEIFHTYAKAIAERENHSPHCFPIFLFILRPRRFLRG